MSHTIPTVTGACEINLLREIENMYKELDLPYLVLGIEDVCLKEAHKEFESLQVMTGKIVEYFKEAGTLLQYISTLKKIQLLDNPELNTTVLQVSQSTKSLRKSLFRLATIGLHLQNFINFYKDNQKYLNTLSKNIEVALETASYIASMIKEELKKQSTDNKA